MANNLDSSREQLLLARDNHGNIGGRFLGFEYAVQSDGTNLAERQWQELRPLRSAKSYFQWHHNSNSPSGLRSLQDVDQRVRTALQQHQQKSRLPEPAAAPANNENLRNRPTAMEPAYNNNFLPSKTSNN